MTRTTLIFLSLLLFSLPSFIYAAEFEANVIYVADGDTITVLNDDDEQIMIRLNGIDCPEKAQAYGNKAKQFTKNLVLGKMVTIQAHNKGKYGRTNADVILDDGRNLSQELVKEGYAWWYLKYASEYLVLKRLEAEAKEAKVGLWADKNPTPPWTFRQQAKQIEDKSKPKQVRAKPIPAKFKIVAIERQPKAGDLKKILPEKK